MRSKSAVDLALINGTVITVARESNVAEAVAVQEDKIIAVGSTAEIQELITPDTEVIDLQGRTVVPGFIDCHCHPSTGGPRSLYEINIQDATSIDDIVEMIGQRARELPAGSWILARRYDDRHLKEKRHPNKGDLDRATTDHPVCLRRRDDHISVANTKALKLANITRDTPVPEGGTIDRDPDTGDPNGVVRDEAQAILRKAVPSYSIDETKKGILYACDEFARHGITSFTDAIVTSDGFAAYQELVNESALPLRAGLLVTWTYSSSYPDHSEELVNLGLRAGFGNKYLRIVGTKFSIDGSMSGRTAALYEPYCQEPGNYGTLVFPPEMLIAEVVRAHKAGLRPCIHAIGDRAIDVALDALETALQERPEPDARLRIEHCSLPTNEALHRFKRLGIMIASSAGFIYELGAANLASLGQERMKYYLPHKTYIDMGIVAAGNSDWSVTNPNVLQQIYGSVTRKSPSGEIIGGNQAIPVMDALRLYTINGAYASFEEDIKGSIEPGKLADFVILDKNILAVNPEEIKDIQVESTIVGGQCIYKK